MATPQAALPPLDRMYLLSSSVEMVLYGINTVVFSGVVYILAIRRKASIASHRYLLATSCLLFSIITIHVALSIQALLEAFVTGPLVGTPDGATLFFAEQSDKKAFVRELLYVASVFVQDLVLIWRLYAVFGFHWQYAVLPAVFEFFHIGAATAAVVCLFRGDAINSHCVATWALTGWSSDLVINIGLTCAIAGRLWWAGRATMAIRARKGNAYRGAVWVMLESGGLFATATVIIVIFYLVPSSQIFSLVGISVVTQLAALSPMLIIVRVGLGLNHVGNPTTYIDTNRMDSSAPRSTHPASKLSASVPVRVGVSVTETNDSTFYASSGGGDAYAMNEMKISQQDLKAEAV